MSGLPWFKCFPQDLLNGMGGMPADERGVYISVLCLIYREGAPIRDEPRELAYNTGCTVRAWTKYRAALILHGKLRVVQINGLDHLSNERCEIELAVARERSERLSEIGSRGGKKKSENSGGKDKENNGDGLANAKPRLSKGLAILDTDLDKDNPPLAPQGGEPENATPVVADPPRQAFDAWNDVARRCDLPVAKSLDVARRRSIRKRLDEGGLAGWTEALEGVERSAFCRGLRPDRDGKTFHADLGFVCQPKSFARLREGFYGRDAKPPLERPATATPEAQLARLQHFRDTGEWKPAWGDKPTERAA